VVGVVGGGGGFVPCDVCGWAAGNPARFEVPGFVDGIHLFEGVVGVVTNGLEG